MRGVALCKFRLGHAIQTKKAPFLRKLDLHSRLCYHIKKISHISHSCQAMNTIPSGVAVSDFLLYNFIPYADKNPWSSISVCQEKIGLSLN